MKKQFLSQKNEKKKKVKILNILFSDSVKLFNVENFLQMKDEDTWLSI